MRKHLSARKHSRKHNRIARKTRKINSPAYVMRGGRRL